MILTFTEDMTSNISLDAELMGVPESGIYLNRGVHPAITIDNILSFLSVKNLTFSNYSASTTYGKYISSRSRSDIVTSNGILYQSLVKENIGNTPSTSPSEWLATNIESLSIKSELFNAQDSLISALKLERKLIENQYIYNIGENIIDLQGNFSGWAFEPKGSDYVKIRINQICLQAKTTSDVNLYVINQGILKETLILHPNNGLLEFEDLNYTIYGKGVFYFVFESQSVVSDSVYNDPLKFTGFVCYPIQGTGNNPASAIYKDANPCGLNFNVTAYSDSSIFIENNWNEFAKALQSQFELNMIRMFISNPRNKTNPNSLNIQSLDKEILYNESINKQGDTVVGRYYKNIEESREAINRTFDNAFKTSTKLTMKVSSL